jgi:hypothetical protein
MLYTLRPCFSAPMFLLPFLPSSVVLVSVINTISNAHNHQARFIYQTPLSYRFWSYIGMQPEDSFSTVSDYPDEVLEIVIHAASALKILSLVPVTLRHITSKLPSDRSGGAEKHKQAILYLLVL